MVVYGDIIVAVNIVMNAIILWLTALAAGITGKAWRIAAASIIGAAYVLISVFEYSIIFYHPVGKGLVSVVIVIIAYGYSSIRMLFFQVGVFYLISFILGGAIWGWLYFLQQNSPVLLSTVSVAVQWSYLFTGIFLGVGLVVFLVRRCLSRMYRKQTVYPVTIEYAGKTVATAAMLDTGNGLYTIVGRKPVMLVELAVINAVLSPMAEEFLTGCQAENWLGNLHECKDIEWLGRVEVVPYRAVGNKSMLLAFRPGSLSITTDSGILTVDHVAVAIYSGMLSNDGTYHALLHPDLFKSGKYEGEANLCA
jgi:stage II sporulation protein GA (sporulation sigma-E factor processing peptidase)